jgi:probable HAF family extracellular repeat protein
VVRKSGKRRNLLWLAAGILVASSGLIVQGQSRYSITDLGTLGGSTSEAAGINILGEVVGSSTTSAGVAHAFLYRNGSMFDLGTLTGGTESHATSINDDGIIVGHGGINAHGPMFQEFTQGFVWQEGMRPLGALYCPCSFNVRYGTSRAFAVNNLGRVVGDSRTGRASFTHAFLWQGNAMSDIGDTLEGAADSVAYAISDIDDVVGEINGRAYLLRGGVNRDLGVLPGRATSSARAVNSKGQVAGHSTTADGIAHAFLWDQGTMRNLGTLPGDAASQAAGINALGQVVGRSGTADFSRSRAVLWQNGVALDLNNVAAAPGWVLTNATAINDVRQIVGVGVKDGQIRAFLLSPR